VSTCARADSVIKDIGKAQENNDLAVLVLDLEGVVSWIFASSFEHSFETLRFAQCFGGSGLCTGEVEAKIVTAPNFAFAANVKE
jgi:hypothetical protein